MKPGNVKIALIRFVVYGWLLSLYVYMHIHIHRPRCTGTMVLKENIYGTIANCQCLVEHFDTVQNNSE